MFLTAICLNLFPGVLAQETKVSDSMEFSDPLNGESLYRDLTHWSQFENHLTGSSADSATKKWLSDKLYQSGYEIELQELEIPLLSFKKAELTVNKNSIECFPIWTPTATGKEPVSGPFVLFDENDPKSHYEGKIVLYPVEALRMKQFVKAQELLEYGIKGLVFNYPHLSGVLGAVNCPEPFHKKQLPIPILLVGNDQLDRLKEMATQNSEASIRIDGEFNPKARTYNIIGRLDRGKDRWMVLSTPATGWFQCVGERGTGVAVLLGLAAWAAHQNLDVNWMICITTGHELAHAGIEHFVKSDVLPSRDSTVAFIALGASVAARDWEQTDSEIKPLPRISRQLRLISTPGLTGNLSDSFGDLITAVEVNQPEGGELRHVMEKGYPSIGLYGSHFWFHTSKDNLETSDPELLASVANALAASFKRILAN